MRMKPGAQTLLRALAGKYVRPVSLFQASCAQPIKPLVRVFLVYRSPLPGAFISHTRP